MVPILLRRELANPRFLSPSPLYQGKNHWNAVNAPSDDSPPCSLAMVGLARLCLLLPSYERPPQLGIFFFNSMYDSDSSLALV